MIGFLALAIIGGVVGAIGLLLANGLFFGVDSAELNFVGVIEKEADSLSLNEGLIWRLPPGRENGQFSSDSGSLFSVPIAPNLEGRIKTLLVLGSFEGESTASESPGGLGDWLDSCCSLDLLFLPLPFLGPFPLEA